MSIDIFTRLRAFNNLYYSVQIGKEFVLPPESREFIFKDDELWDHLGRLDERLALERYGISIEAGSPEELTRIVTRYAQEVKEAKFLLDKFETDNEGIRAVFNRFSGGETIVALDEKIAEMEEDLMKAPEYIKLKAKNKELRRQLIELKQSAGSGLSDTELKVKIRELEAQLNQIKPKFDEYRAHPGMHIKPDEFIKILAVADKAKEAIKEKDEAKQKLAVVENVVAGEKAAKAEAKALADELRVTLTERETKYKTDMAAKDEQIIAARKQVDNAEKETAAAKTEYEQNLAAKESEFSEAKSELEKKIESRDTTIKKTDEQLVSLGQTADRLNKEKQQLELQQEQKIREAVEAKEKELAKQYGATTQEHVGSIQTLEEDLVQKQGKINEYEGTIAQLEHAAAARKQKLTELEGDVSDLRTELTEAKEEAGKVPELQSTIEQYEAELPGLRTEAAKVPGLQSKIETYETKITGLEEQKEKDAQELADKNQRVQDLVDQIAQLETAAEELRTKGHEGEDVISKAKYDADIAAKEEELERAKGELTAVEGAQKAVEQEYESRLKQQKQDLEKAAKQKLAEQEEQHKKAFEAHDQKDAAARQELSEKISALETQIEEAKKAVAVPEGMEVIPKEELTNLRKGVRPDGKMLVDEEVANEYMAQKGTIQEQQDKIATQQQTINKQKGTINRMGQDISAKVTALEAANKARDELQTAFEQYKQEQEAGDAIQFDDESNVIRFKPEDSEETSKLFTALDELAKAYDFKLTTPDVDSSDEIQFIADPTVDDYIALLTHVRSQVGRPSTAEELLREAADQARNEGDTKAAEELEQDAADIAAQDTQPLPDVSEPAARDPEPNVAKHQEEVRASSADTQPISVTEDPEPATAPEPAAPVPEPASVDAAASGPSYTSEPDAEPRSIQDIEKAWYNTLTAAISHDNVKSLKRELFQGFLDSGIKNKRVEAYIYGNLAEEHFSAGEYAEALALTRDAQNVAKLAYQASKSAFDKAQVANLEHNITMLEKKTKSKSA